MTLLKISLKIIFTKISLGLLVFFIPLIGNAFQSSSDSLKLASSLDSLKAVNPDSADSIVRFSDRLIEAYSKPERLAELRKINQTSGFLLARYGYLQLAEKYYLDGLNLAQKLKDKLSEVNITNSLGVLWAKRGDYVKAESSFLKALLIAEKEDYTEGITACYLKLSTLRIKQNRPDDCLVFCAKADSVNQRSGTHFYESDLIGNKGIVYAIRGNLDKALSYFQNGYDFALKEGKVIEQVLAFQNIGLVYKEKGDFDKAFENLNKGLALAKKSGLREEELRIAINIPIVLVSKKEFKLAKVKLLDLLVEAKKTGLEDLTLEIYTNLIEIEKTQGNYKKAFDYFTQYTGLKDKQVNEQKQRALQEANITLGLYKANEILAQNKSLLFATSRERNILLSIVIFAVLLLIMLVFVLLRLKKLNDKLNRKKEQLTESNNIKTKLFSIIGHDLRSNQSTTLGILNLIKDGELEEAEAKLYLDMLVKQSQSALATLDDLLLWGRAQIKGNKLEKSTLDIDSVVKRAIDLNSEAIHNKNLSLQTVDLEDKKVYLDGNHFSFIIRNLIANAIKFTPYGGKITVYVEHDTENLFKICIADNGVGVRPGELESIFSSENVSKRGTDNEPGTGLGLTLCKEFVEVNGGSIWAEINADEGTTFCFTCEKSGC